MEKLTTPERSPWASSLRPDRVLHAILVIGMMATLAVGVLHFVRRMAGPWNGGYLVGLVIVVALLAIIGHARAAELDLRERWLFYLSEWVAIAVAVKIIQTAIHRTGPLIDLLQSWQEDFFGNFLTGEYLLVLVVLAGVWFLSKAYTADFETLFERENDADWDEIGKLQNTLHSYRGQIAARIFLVGAIVVLLAVLSRVDLGYLQQWTGFRPLAYTAPVANVLVYFIFALLLLSQTQFTLLRARWRWQHARVQADLARQWLRVSALFFVIVTAVIFLLPTEYSVGLFDMLRFAAELFLRLAAVIIGLLMLPLSFCLALFRIPTGEQPAAQPMPETIPAPPTTPSTPIAWWEMLRMLLFWAIFFAILIFALRYYLFQNKDLIKKLRGTPILGRVLQWFQVFWRWLRGANQRLLNTIRQGINRLQPARTGEPTSAGRRIARKKPSTPREHVLEAYERFLELGQANGLPRSPQKTPYQYQQQVHGEVPEASNDLTSLTETFLEARYSQHEIAPPAAETAQTAWARIKTRWNSRRRPPGASQGA